MKCVIIFFALVASISVAALAPCSGNPERRLSPNEAKGYLRQCGVGVSSSGGCENKSNPKCTSLDGILCGTINGVCVLKSASGCITTMTGGTEVGHPSIPEDLWTHESGWKVNIRKTKCINSYIHRFLKIKNCRDGSPQYVSHAGNYYCDGRDSWDV
ncbi:hypothetical protein FRC07_006929, partial [Ceratobasidium sp. 392]